MTLDLFESTSAVPTKQELAPGAFILRAFALEKEAALLDAVEAVQKAAPFRHMQTPGGFRMSVAMTNCGGLGWVADRSGYRYDRTDPLTASDWPQMPDSFLALATQAAAEAGFKMFVPDACLINRYEPGARLTLHQDKDENDYAQPIVSVSLGVPAVFLFGGFTRSAKTDKIRLEHGDVVVWGGPSRLRYHGITPLKESFHPRIGPYRFNLTFRKAG